MRAAVITVALGVAIIAQTAPVPSDSSGASVGTVLVATTARGQPVLDLGPTDLTVLADGLPARIEYMQAVGRALAVVLMFDVSQSMRGKLDFYQVREFGTKVVATLRADDRVRFGELCREIAVGQIAPHSREYFSAPPALIPQPEREDRPARSLMTSPIWDAVAAGVEAVRADERHRLVVLVTDGLVTGSRIGLEDAIQLATAAQTVVSVVDVHEAKTMVVPQDSQKRPAEFRPDQALRRLAAGTGGAYFANAEARGEQARYRVGLAPEIPAFVTQAISESRGAYRIRLQIPSDGAPHSVKITSSRSGVVIRTPSEIRP
jgi:hypothetical protein